MAGEAYQSTTAFTDYAAKYRYYNPTTMRWLKRDPLGMVDGPNVYALVRGNVVNAVDLRGVKNVLIVIVNTLSVKIMLIIGAMKCMK